LLFNLALLALLVIISSLLAIAMLRIRVGNPGLLVALLAMGMLGLVSATTLIAAIIARASVKGALFAVLAFPLLVPLLVVTIQGTDLAFSGFGWDRGILPLQVLVGYTIALLTTSLFLFGSVWET
jgi:heme exporter protein B